MPDLSDRDLRQRDIVPPDRLERCWPTVIGVGAIGRQVAIQLAAVGVPRLQLIDPDVVEPHNISSQGFFESDMGNPKVKATTYVCRAINKRLEITTHVRRYGRTMKTGNVIFCCVDSIDARRHIWQSIGRQTSFFADGRMSAEVVRVLTAVDEPSREHYASTMFAADEAFVGSCTARSTIFTANIAAGLMLEQFTKWLRDLPVDADMTFNLLAGELEVCGRSPTLST